MKVHEILNEQDGPEEPGFNISEDEMELIFRLVHKRELDQRDVPGMARELVDEGEFRRSPASAEFIINRMHVLIHGIAPYGYSEQRAEKMLNPSRGLVQFLANKGFDTEENIRKARIDLKNRKPKINQQQATQMMAQAAKDLQPEQRRALGPMRNEIVADIMAGLTPQEAFARHS